MVSKKFASNAIIGWYGSGHTPKKHTLSEIAALKAQKYVPLCNYVIMTFIYFTFF